MSTAYPELQHMTAGHQCESPLKSGERCQATSHQLCRHCGRITCGRHEDQHALCPVRAKQ